MEISSSAKASSLWAIVFTNEVGKVQVESLGIAPTPGKWNEIEIRRFEKKIFIYVNGIKESSLNVGRLKVSLKKIIVGSGFKDRFTHGEIRDFKMNLIGNNYLHLVAILMFITAILSFFPSIKFNTTVFFTKWCK
jgi:hypothetical protein